MCHNRLARLVNFGACGILLIPFKLLLSVNHYTLEINEQGKHGPFLSPDFVWLTYHR